MSISLGDQTTTPIRKKNTKNTLLRKIARACRTSLPETDFALNLDVVDFINEKQGSTPRDAIVAIGKLINNRDPHIALLSLSLLDILVKNCGYPIHLQISTKEFLNNLVRVFPEFPPHSYSLLERNILKMIEEWYRTLCVTAAYKEDLYNIRDIHSLLYQKGYSFPTINENELTVLQPSKTFKTASEIKDEQEMIQGAKLDELIRRGRPEDLRQANKLMKIMAGFKQDNLVLAQKEIIKELTSLKIKLELLDDMLINISENNDGNISDIKDNDSIQELLGEIKSATPKLDKLLTEVEDGDLSDQILQFKNSIEKVLLKYNFLKDGNLAESQSIQVPRVATPILTSHETFHIHTDSNQSQIPDQNIDQPVAEVTQAVQEVNLLDFWDDDDTPALSTTQQTPVQQNDTYSNNDDTDLLADLLADLDSSPTKTNNIDLNLNGTSKLSLQPPQLHTLNQSKNLKIEFEVTRENDSRISIKFFFSNLTPAIINSLTFSLAVPKRMTLNLNPQSSDSLPSLSNKIVHQFATIDNVLINDAKSLQLKWMATYFLNNSTEQINETAIYKFPMT